MKRKTIGKREGLSEAVLLAARERGSADPKTDAALKFAAALVEGRGEISDQEFARVRQVGFTDGEIAEIIANVALNLFTNYFNKAADVSLDFPRAPVLSRKAA